MEHLQTERDSLAQEVRRLRKHANALKISGRLRRIHADGAGSTPTAPAPTSIRRSACTRPSASTRCCGSSSGWTAADPRPYRNFKLTNATIASVIATR
jgi:hypothetical protein